jgi:hypothetical protein
MVMGPAKPAAADSPSTVTHATDCILSFETDAMNLDVSKRFGLPPVVLLSLRAWEQVLVEERKSGSPMSK